MKWRRKFRQALKFMDAEKGSGKGNKTGSFDMELNYIRKLYAVENQNKGLRPGTDAYPAAGKIQTGP